MAENENVKITVSRGPSYPSLTLEKALQRAQQIADRGAARNKLPPETFYKIWEYGAKSSGARQTMAALNAYGLVEYIGKGKDRRVELTDLARRIILDKRPNSPDRAQHIQRAALEPTIFRELFNEYAGPVLPDRDVMISWLTIDRQFNQQGAEVTADNFIATFEFAGLNAPSNNPFSESSQNAENMVTSEVEVGDRINFESNGVIVNESPLDVRAISDDRMWVFVEGSETGMPMEDVAIVEKGVKKNTPPTMPLATAQPDSHAAPALDASAPLDVRFNMKSVSVSGTTTDPAELQSFIDQLTDLKSILEKWAVGSSAD